MPFTVLYDFPQVVQRPTHSRLHVRDARDAHIVFEAVRQGLLERVLRRLNEDERLAYIRSGSLFVWEENDDEVGLKRWTDGRVWSQSRLREPYLFYDEKLAVVEPTCTPKGPTFRFIEGPSWTWSSSAQSHYERSDYHLSGLVKQAYSAKVLLPGGAKPRKWHLTAYFTYDDLPNIPTVDQDPLLQAVSVPPGVYTSSKARSRNSDRPRLALPTFAPMLPTPANTLSLLSPVQASPKSGSAGIALPSLRTVLEDVRIECDMPIQSAKTWYHCPSAVRMAEDRRLIQLLNSRPIL
ncbi:hypothetical protein GY45DRAFT_1376474 [Cubamyces sp. BRFM 1775]|nr:hypothetical protein GY45DRAFT_1376474 [Cubamyces sp. BRFM 1775]